MNMVNERTWHKDAEQQTTFTWIATDDGIELDHGNGNPPYTIPWATVRAVLSYAKNQAAHNNNIIAAGTGMINPTPGSVGAWVQTQHLGISTGNLTPKHLSFLGPIFGRMGFINRELNGNSILWNFNI